LGENLRKILDPSAPAHQSRRRSEGKKYKFTATPNP
jgi:hypothetical protein